MSEAEKAALLAAQEEEERLALEAEIKRLEDERLAKEEEVLPFYAADCIMPLCRPEINIIACPNTGASDQGRANRISVERS